MTDESETATWQKWHKHGPAYDAQANCDVWGISAEPYERGEEQVMRMWVFSEADADTIIADHNQARRVPGLVKALEEIGCVYAIPCVDMRAFHHPDHEFCARCAALIDAEVSDD